MPKKKLDYISITDHNTAKAYKKLEQINISRFFSGKIIPGIELNTKILNIPIEVLGYGIDYKKINNDINKIYIPAHERNLIEVQRLYEKCIKYGIILEKNCLANYSSETFASVFFHNEITKFSQNKNLISKEAWDSSKIFYRQYMSNPQGPLYVEMDDFVPDFKTVYKLIKDSNGLLFIPHIYEYKENSNIILENILKNYKIDGIECYYSTFTLEQTQNLLKICAEKNFFVSGGSDFHGKYKSEVDIGIGLGNLNVPTSILDNWVNKINLLT